MRTKTGPLNSFVATSSGAATAVTAALTLGWLLKCERTQISRSFVRSSAATRWQNLPDFAGTAGCTAFFSFRLKP